jgi:predicted aconitase with swiveling domain
MPPAPRTHPDGAADHGERLKRGALGAPVVSLLVALNHLDDHAHGQDRQAEHPVEEHAIAGAVLLLQHGRGVVVVCGVRASRVSG